MQKKFIFVSVLVIAGAFFAPEVSLARTLSTGVQGDDVKELQTILVSKGYLAATPNGYFGPATLAAVKQFQCEQKIVCSGSSYGVAGPNTQASLGIVSAASVAKQTNFNGVLTPKATGKFEFSGWIPYWREEAGTADTASHIKQLASVMPFTYTLRTDGTINDAGGMAGEPWKSFVATAKANKVRVVPTLMSGNGDLIHTLLSDPTSRAALITQIVNLVNTQGFDGIDIDFEAKKAETRGAFSTFLRELYARIGSKWVYCTVEARSPISERYDSPESVPPDATNFVNDYVEMNKYCDRVEIMAYDQGTISRPLNKQQTGPYAPVADPKWVSNLITLAAQTISRNKLIVGIPTYGYEYQVTPTATGYQFKVLWPFNPTYGVNLAAKLGISPVRSGAGEPSFSYVSSGQYSPTGDQTDINPQSTFGAGTVFNTNGTSTATGSPFNYITWSDSQAIADKVALARKLGIRGVAVFKFDGGQDPAMWSVLK